MANDRMFLLHRPTGLAAPLGKRYTTWYPSNDVESLLATLFDVAGFEGLGDYVVVLESENRWQYSGVGPQRIDGLVELVEITL